MGGGGHMMEMNRRMEANRAAKLSNRKDSKKAFYSRKNTANLEQLLTKDLSPEEWETIQARIQQKAKRIRLYNSIILGAISIVVLFVIFKVLS